MKITELIKKHADLLIALENAKELLDESYIAYHTKLIDSGFYKEYEIDGMPIDKFFYIRPYSLPEKDQGEGDFIRLDLVVDGSNLNVIYECSWRMTDNYTIASLPFDILDGDLEALKDYLIESNKADREQKMINKIAIEKKDKAQKIANLKLQLKNLGEKV